jgi:hypothetical protein
MKKIIDMLAFYTNRANLKATKDCVTSDTEDHYVIKLIVDALNETDRYQFSIDYKDIEVKYCNGAGVYIKIRVKYDEDSGYGNIIGELSSSNFRGLEFEVK